MNKVKPIVTRDTVSLARELGLTHVNAVEMEIRRHINDKIIRVVNDSALTHAGVARLAKTSRSRLTAILNRNTANVSTDLMLRILGALRYKAKIAFTRARHAA